MEKENNKLLIAARIKAAREDAGLSQGQVALKLKMHRPTISEIEAGRRKVSAEEIAAFANLYGVETWWLSCADSKEERDPEMVRYQLAARKLSKMKPEDFESLLDLLSSIQKDGGNVDVKN
jgi:transcriptional regulator with XRE-family HTH domain